MATVPDENETYSELLAKWDLAAYVNNFRKEGLDDLSDWDALIANNGKELKESNLIDKAGHRNKFIRLF